MLLIIETLEHESFPYRLMIRYFHAIQSHREDRPAAAVAEAAAAYEPEMPFSGGRAFKIRQRVLEEFPSGRRAADAEELPDRNKTRWAVGVPGSWAPEQMGEDEALLTPRACISQHTFNAMSQPEGTIYAWFGCGEHASE